MVPDGNKAERLSSANHTTKTIHHHHHHQQTSNKDEDICINLDYADDIHNRSLHCDSYQIHNSIQTSKSTKQMQKNTK